ncbi:hypothetical protein Bp8pS_113 [Bacillus phage vB_BpuM-BpSp]|nr:hypothetical protein Bp8pS_113 [Bacillus phage vB_BpuM-BpSp]
MRYNHLNFSIEKLKIFKGKELFIFNMYRRVDLEYFPNFYKNIFNLIKGYQERFDKYLYEETEIHGDIEDAIFDEICKVYDEIERKINHSSDILIEFDRKRVDISFSTYSLKFTFNENDPSIQEIDKLIILNKLGEI